MRRATLSDRLRLITDTVFSGNGRLAARTARLDATAYHRLEAGNTPNPRLTTLQALAEHFGLPVGYMSGERSADDLQETGPKLAEEYWLLLRYYRMLQAPSRDWIASVAAGPSSRESRKNRELLNLSELSVFPLEQQSPLSSLRALLNREKPKKEEIALVRGLFEIETQALELTVKKLKELELRG